jgi:hypothetical protein
MHTKILVKNLKQRDHFGDPGTNDVRMDLREMGCEDV